MEVGKPQHGRPRAATTSRCDAESDVLIIGSGLLGTSVARMVRETRPDATIIMVAGGPRMGAVPGQHLHDSPDGSLRRRFAAGAAVNQQNLYVGAARHNSPTATRHDLAPGLHGIGAVGNGPGGLPGAAVAWNEGGMGIHWAAGTPPPFGDEAPAMVNDESWPADLLPRRRFSVSVTTPSPRTPCPPPFSMCCPSRWGATDPPHRSGCRWPSPGHPTERL